MGRERHNGEKYMRIGYITHGFPPLIGGTETHNYSCVKYLSEKGHSVEVIIPTTKLYLQENFGYLENKTLQAESYTLPELRNVTIHYLFTKRFKGYYDLWKKINEIERNSKIDVFDIHHMFCALAFPKKRNIVCSLHFPDFCFPCIYWPSIYKNGYYTLGTKNSCCSFKNCIKCIGVYPYLKWRLARHYATKVITKYMVKRDYLKELMVQSGIPDDKIEVIPYWIDGDNILKQSKSQHKSKLLYSKNQLHIDEENTVFGFVGRLDAYNGPLLVLKAFSKLLKKRLKQEQKPSILGKNLKLCFLGDGSFRKDLESFSRENELQNNVMFLGAILHSEIFKYFSVVDIFVFAHWYSNYGWSLLEAMSTKKPIIATRTIDIAEILKDRYNALLTESTVDSLAEKMEEILNSPDLAKKLGENAFKTIKTEHKLENLEKYEELLYQVAKKNI